jgi:glycosyltransferase involved in cell wall biosynthesis
LDTTFRLLARRVRTLVAGGDIARRYGGRDRVFVMADAVVSERDLAAGPRTPRSSKRIELLTVARIDPEKNPLLLVDVLAHLERVAPGRYRLTWVGGGPLEERVRQYAAERGVAALVDLRGWLPFGDRLLDLYRRADIFVHVSRTEGAPRVVFEALACATPVVATDVGGVRAMVDDGRAALLVPVDDAPALASAVRRLDSEDELRRRLVVHGLALARERTLERQAARVASFIAADEVCAA